MFELVRPPEYRKVANGKRVRSIVSWKTRINAEAGDYAYANLPAFNIDGIWMGRGKFDGIWIQRDGITILDLSGEGMKVFDGGIVTIEDIMGQLAPYQNEFRVSVSLLPDTEPPPVYVALVLRRYHYETGEDGQPW